MLADESEVFVSTVPWWEIAIKIRIGKLDAELTVLRQAAFESGFSELPLLGSHAEVLTTLPRYHNDPFDHMLVAQAMAEPMRFISGDRLLAQYTPLVLQI